MEQELPSRMRSLMERLSHHHMRALSMPDGETDLTRAQMSTLIAIGRREPAPMGDLARELAIAPGSLTGITDRLIEKGFVKRERNQNDRRKVMASLSDKGRAVYGRFQEVESKFSDKLFSLLTHEESLTLVDLMERIVNGLEAPARKRR